MAVASLLAGPVDENDRSMGSWSGWVDQRAGKGCVLSLWKTFSRSIGAKGLRPWEFFGKEVTLAPL